ncbi:MAG: hypothetical protein WA859_13445, partial [Candidatus Sulfotelmatobacter sp.]
MKANPEEIDDVKENGRGRAADRDLNVECGRASVNHLQWGTFFLLCAFALALGGGVGFLFIYWIGGSNLLLGGTLALCLAGFGVALVLYSHWLMPHKEATEPREELPSSRDDREEVAENFNAGAEDIHRRGLLKWIAASVVGISVATVVSLIRGLGTDPFPALFD